MFLTYRGELDNRLDCEFYLFHFKQNINRLKLNKYDRLGNIVSFSKETWNQKDIYKNQFPYIEIGEIDLEIGKIKNINYLPIKDAPSRAKMIVRTNDILVSTTRPHRGAITKIDFNQDGFICSTGFAVLRKIINKNISKNYLSFILREKFVLLQMQQRSSGGNYPAITQDELKKIIIPIPTDINIVYNLLNEAQNTKRANKKKSKEQINNFNNLLNIQNISIPFFTVKTPQVKYLKSLENALNVERYAFSYELENPENWQTIKGTGTIHIQTLTPSKEENKEQTFTLLRIDDLPKKPFKVVSRTVQGIEVEGNVQHISTNDVLVSRLAPTIRNKKIIVAPKSDFPIIGSNEFIRLTCNEENNPVFVCYLLRTKFYTELMLSKSRGSTPSRYRLSRADFEKLPFPKVPKPIQDKIAEEYLKNIEEAQRLIQEGKEAVKKAKAEVERMILGEDSI